MAFNGMPPETRCPVCGGRELIETKLFGQTL